MSTRSSASSDPKACRLAGCVQLFVDGELDPGRAMDVETHLADCEPCAERAELLRALKGSLRRRCGATCPDALRSKLLATVEREVAREAGLDGGTSEALPAIDGTSRESLLSGMRESVARGAMARHDRDGRASTRGSGRMAYGVGALALAAGVALALVGERLGARDALAPTASGPRTGGDGTLGSIGNRPVGDGAESVGATEASRESPEPSRAGGLGLAGGAPPRELIPVMAPPSAAGPALAPLAQPERSAFDSVLDDLAALHANPLPPETTNPDELRKFEPIVGVKLRRPSLRSYDARFRGARLHALRDAQRAAMLQYILRNDRRVTVYLFDPRAIPFGSTRLQRRMVQEEPVYVGQFRGYSVAAAERKGVGYAVATDFDTDESVRLVATELR